jgi:hypothetical protein
MYYIFIKDKESAFLNSILPDAAAFSCSRYREISSCYDVKYGFMVPRYTKWYYSGLLYITVNLMILVIIQETENSNIGNV